jgi:chemotaxis-related protein WspB
MLLLLFEIGGDRYALAAERIRELLPLVSMRAMPQAPAGVAGLFDLRGTPVPAIDLTQLVVGRPAERCLSTRLVIIDYPDGDGGTQPLGVIVEKATRVVQRQRADFVDAGLTHERTWYLGPVMRDGNDLVQWVDVTMLLPAHVRDMLFQPPVTSSWAATNSSAS